MLVQEHGSQWAMRRRPIVIDQHLDTLGGAMGARLAAECVLDVLFNAGKLSAPHDPPGEAGSDAAKRRHEAGLWLRRLYARCQIIGNVTAVYGVGGRDRGEISDEDAQELSWNRKCLRETGIAMAQRWRILRNVCALDEKPGAVQIIDLRDALDALADHRGM